MACTAAEYKRKNYTLQLRKKSKLPVIRVRFPVQMCMMISATRSREKENGSYILLSKFEDDVIFEYHITVMDDDFNLGVLTMRTPEGVFETDFDE